MAYNVNPDVWAMKFKQEGWTFAFGSLMQAYAQKFSPTTLKEFETTAYELYQLSKRMCAESVDEVQAEKSKTAEPNDIEILQD